MNLPNKLLAVVLGCFIFLSNASLYCQTQKNFASFGMGFGLSTLFIPSAVGTLSFERNNNEFTFFAHAAHTFLRTRKYGAADHRYWYNDRLGEYGLLYGRTYRTLKGGFFSISAGVSKFQFVDKSLETYDGDGNWKYSSATVKEKSVEEYGLSFHTVFGIPPSEKAGINLRISVNVNQEVTFLLFTFNFTFNVLPGPRKRKSSEKNSND